MIISCQDAELIAQFDQLNMNLGHTYAMLSTLYVTAEMHALSSSSDEDGNASIVPSSQAGVGEPEALEMVIDDEGNLDS